MTTAPTPSEQEVRAIADELERAAAFPAYPPGPHRAAAMMLRRLQAENARLQGSLDAQRLISDRAIALAKELEARKPLPWEPGFDFMVPGQEELAMQFCLEIAGPRGKKGSPPDPVRLMEMAQALYKAEADAALVDKSPDLQEPLVDKTAKLQDRQRFYGFFHSSCIYESDAELVSLHATKAGAWRAMHRAQWLAWEKVRTLQLTGRLEPGWKAYWNEASHIGLVKVQP